MTIGKVNKGTLEIDLHELVDHLSDDARTNLCRYLVADDMLFRAVLECVVDGRYHQDDADGEWWFGSDAVAALREKLLPLMDDVAIATIKALMTRAAREESLHRQYMDWAFKLYHAWPDVDRCPRPEVPRDLPRYEWATNEDARALLEKAQSDV
jgi:hypothetical protein